MGSAREGSLRLSEPEVSSEEWERLTGILDVRRLAWYAVEDDTHLLATAVSNPLYRYYTAERTTVICDPRRTPQQQAADLVRIARAIMEHPEFYVEDPSSDEIRKVVG